MDTAEDTAAPVSGAQAAAAEPPAERWIRLEIMGHREHWGRARQVDEFGVAMIAIEVPQGSAPDAPMIEYRYSGGAIFGIMACDESAARHHCRYLGKPVISAQYRLTGPDGEGDGEGEERPELY